MTDMRKFNTHGGYFSPQGYLRINEGGSHDENPNGGVQLGTDGQGIPNMLEENEPVYNDFVYSDNIRASAEMLRKHKLPEKFSGKLFSEIADLFVDEAEERPNDPISNNGLNAMLVRLADAQEEQKQLDEQAELEREIAALSPEEQAELEQMLVAQEAQQASGQPMSQEEVAMMQSAPQEVVPQEATPEEAAMVQQYSQPQMMAGGGFIRRFGDGTPGVVTASGGDTPETVVAQDGLLPEGTSMPFNVNPETGGVSGGILMRVNPETGDLVDDITPSRVVAFPGKTQAWVDAEVGPEGRKFKQQIADGRRRFAENAYSIFDEASLPLYFVPGVGEVLMAKDAVADALNGDFTTAGLFFGPGKYVKQGKKVVKRTAKYAEKVKKAEEARTRLAAAKSAQVQAQSAFDGLKNQLAELGRKKELLTDPASIKQAEQEIAELYKKYYEARRQVHKATTGVLSASANKALRSTAEWLAQDPSKPMSKGRKAAYWVGSAAGLAGTGLGLDAIVDAVNDSKNGTTFHPYNPIDDAEFQIDSDSNDFARGGLMRQFSAGSPDGEVVDLLKTVTPNVGVEQVWPGVNDWKRGQVYGHFLPPDFGNTVHGTDIPVPYSEEWYAEMLREQHGQRVAAQSGASSTVVAPTAKTMVSVPSQQSALAHRSYKLPFDDKYKVKLHVALPELKKPADIPSRDKQDKERKEKKKSVQRAKAADALRYASVVTNGLMGLYNAFQKPDRYTLPTYTPTLPTGRLSFVNPVYNPLDENRFVNSVLADAAGARRAILNSGAGPSVNATLLAQNHVTGLNIGDARLRAQEANLQRYNDVIARHNANAQALGQFNSHLSAQRAGMLNNAQLQNMQNMLNLQRLNYGAEGEKAAAVSGSLNAVGKGLADIGNENYMLNGVRTTPGLVYARNADGSVSFVKKEGCGGLLKRYKK